ncbi:MAG: aspartate carbamoyltransferase regulatory subunit [Ruminococcaceae bacterium]|nr:aspartate carbamoyltransferase regulatory subunit [Oscillospiraceae bacterium]
MNIDSIKNGMVIDHIASGKSMEIYELLQLEKLDCQVAIIKNAQSRKMGKKDIIKIDSDVSIDFEILGYIDTDITVNIIKNGVLVEKRHLSLPEKLVNVITCKNPRCITTVEQGIDRIFKLTNKENGEYRCAYCETKAKE